MKKITLCLLAMTFSIAAFAAKPAARTSFRLETPNLCFEIAPDATGAKFFLPGKEDKAITDSDFWRLILDDGNLREIPVFSHMQKGTVTELKKNAQRIRIDYTELTSDYGTTYPIGLSIEVSIEGDLLRFTPTVTNGTQDTRVNECYCPLADFRELVGDKRKDALYWPHGLGRKIDNPWWFMMHQTDRYYAHNDYEITLHGFYPRQTMAWFGIQSGDKFLYLARPDEQVRQCIMTVHQRIHYYPTDLSLGFDHFPMAQPGETVGMASSVIGLLDGDWRQGAERYRAWAETVFFQPREKAQWVREMTGWQRLVMREQNGHELYKYSDLPGLLETGRKYGINTLFLFGWWKEGMDIGYPDYNEPYPGAYKELADNIRKVQEMGGRVILECNATMIDPNTDFYREHGREVALLNINGDEHRPAFVYPGWGALRVEYGKVPFAAICTGSTLWQQQMHKQIRQLNDFGADCLFADCYGGCPTQPCFNTLHEHGPRVDQEWTYHRRLFRELDDFARSQGRVFATEVVTDVAAEYTQFIHGLVNVDFKIKGDAFPAMFRYTFPEVITTERGIRSSEGDFLQRIKHALVYGVRFDGDLHVCRADLGQDPKFAAGVKFLADHLTRYGEFYFYGKFTVIDTSPLPYYIKRGEYLSADGSRVMRVLYNASDKSAEACGVKLAPDEVKYEFFDRKAYGK